MQTINSSETTIETSAPRLSDWPETPARRIKSTQSICPYCLRAIEAQVFERQGEVWMDKHCSEHGDFSVLLASDIRHYYEPLADTQATPLAATLASQPAKPAKSCCGSSCGPQAGASSKALQQGPWANHSCTILIEITERCNLSCPTCFAGSTPQHSHMMSLEEFTRQVDQLVAGGKSGSDMIQLSGGEPTIHPDFMPMVELLLQRGFRNVCINSNGIKLAQPRFTSRLARCVAAYPDAELFVYLQFDGFEEDTYQALRGRNDLLPAKQKALALCEANGINVHPVMTLTRGINDHEVGDFIRLAVEQPELNNVVIQPAMYSGRYNNPRLQRRLTLADTVELICQQTGVFTAEDFMPIPCSDPNCFGMAVAFRTNTGLVPVSRYFPRYADWGKQQARELIDAFSNTINGPAAISAAINWATSNSPMGQAFDDLDDAQLEQLMEAVIEAQQGGKSLWDKLLTISIKPFMDAWSYDQDRIDGCCVHILDREGNPVSFCEYNAINRPRMVASQQQSITASVNIKVISA